MQPTQMTPAAIDAEIARLYSRLDQAEADYERDRRSLEDGRPGNLFVNRESTLDHMDSLANLARSLRHELRPFEGEYLSRRWARYFLVTNGNGHVHSTMGCTTCFPTTSYAWLTVLSGATEAEMVAEWGERACTVCFPSAPTNPDYRRPAKVDREARDARAAERAARQAARAAKDLDEPLILPDTRAGRTETIRTVAAAKQALREAVSEQITDPAWLSTLPNWTPAEIARLVEVLRRRAELARAALTRKGLGASEVDKIEAAARRKAEREVASR